MPAKIRLQRKGKKGKPFYHVVIADGRAPRDGKFIERLGTYDPTTDPATIDINFDRALYWVQVGAQPTDTARSILSREGVLMMDHLLRGVKKGAHSEEEAKEKFQTWLKEKTAKVEQIAKDAELSEKDLKKKRLEDERKVNEERAAALAKKYAVEAKKEAQESQSAEEVAEETTEEVAETPEAETKAEETQKEAPAAEVKEEAPAAEEAKEEAPAAEEAKEETDDAKEAEEKKEE
ncbi:MAG: 30S ribosomal protein S16 [Bacteroidales bacterium]|nr:30S ribosomal protein S16 [Bacteroidales bacterium]